MRTYRLGGRLLDVIFAHPDHWTTSQTRGQFASHRSNTLTVTANRRDSRAGRTSSNSNISNDLYFKQVPIGRSLRASRDMCNVAFIHSLYVYCKPKVLVFGQSFGSW